MTSDDLASAWAAGDTTTGANDIAWAKGTAIALGQMPPDPDEGITAIAGAVTYRMKQQADSLARKQADNPDYQPSSDELDPLPDYSRKAYDNLGLLAPDKLDPLHPGGAFQTESGEPLHPAVQQRLGMPANDWRDAQSKNFGDIPVIGPVISGVAQGVGQAASAATYIGARLTGDQNPDQSPLGQASTGISEVMGGEEQNIQNKEQVAAANGASGSGAAIWNAVRGGAKFGTDIALSDAAKLPGGPMAIFAAEHGVDKAKEAKSQGYSEESSQLVGALHGVMQYAMLHGYGKAIESVAAGKGISEGVKKALQGLPGTAANGFVGLLGGDIATKFLDHILLPHPTDKPIGDMVKDAVVNSITGVVVAHAEGAINSPEGIFGENSPTVSEYVKRKISDWIAAKSPLTEPPPDLAATPPTEMPAAPEAMPTGTATGDTETPETEIPVTKEPRSATQNGSLQSDAEVQPQGTVEGAAIPTNEQEVRQEPGHQAGSGSDVRPSTEGIEDHPGLGTPKTFPPDEAPRQINTAGVPDVLKEASMQATEPREPVADPVATVLGHLSRDLGGADVKEVDPQNQNQQAVAQWTQGFGKHTVYVDSADKRWDGYHHPDAPDHIFIRSDSASPAIAVGSHEIAHALSLDKSVSDFDRATLAEAGKRYGAKAAAAGIDVDPNKIQPEAVGQLLQDMAEANPARFMRLSQQNPTLVEKIGTMFKKLTGQFTPQDKTEAAIFKVLRDRFQQHQDSMDRGPFALNTGTPGGNFAPSGKVAYNQADIEAYNKRNGIDSLPDRITRTDQETRQQAMNQGIPDKALEIAASGRTNLTSVEQAGLSIALDKHEALIDSLSAMPTDDPAQAAHITARITALKQDQSTIADALWRGRSEAGHTLGIAAAREFQNMTAQEVKDRLATLKGDKLTPAQEANVDTLIKTAKAKANEVDKVTPITVDGAAKLTDSLEQLAGDKPTQDATKELTGAVGGKLTTKAAQDLTAEVNEVHDRVQTLPADFDKLIKEMHYAEVAQGHDPETAVNNIHGMVQGIFPDIDKQTIRQKISDYGELKIPSQAALDKAVRDSRAQIRELAKLDDLEKGQAPLATGMKRDAASPELKALQQKVLDKIKAGQYETHDPNVELSSAQWREKQAAFLKQKIADYQDRLTKQDYSPISKTGKPYSYDEAIANAKDKLTGLRKDYQQQKGEDKGYARDLAKLSDLKQHLANGTIPPTGSAPNKLGKRAIVQDAINEVRQKIRDSEPALAKAMTDRLNRLQKKLEQVDFKPLPKPQENPPPRIARLQTELWDAQRQLRRQEVDIQPKTLLGRLRQGSDFFKGEAVNFGFHGFGRTGIKALASNPQIFSGTLAETANRCRTAEGAKDMLHEIYNRESTPRILKAGGQLYFDSRHELSGGEKNLIDKGLEASKIGKPIASMRRYFRDVYTVGMTAMRSRMFEAAEKGFCRNGVSTPAEAKQIMAMVHSSTGAANLNQTGQSMVNAASIPFLAPGYTISKYQWAMGQPLWKAGEMRGYVLSQYAKQLGALGAIVGVGALSGHVHLNTDDTDFGKLTFGNQKIDPWGGMAQTLRFVGKMTGLSKETVRRVVTGHMDRSAGSQANDAMNEVSKYFKNQLAPLPALAMEGATGKNSAGNPASAMDVPKLFTPYTVQDFVQQTEKQGIAKPLAELPMLIMGTNAYEQPPGKPKRTEGQHPEQLRKDAESSPMTPLGKARRDNAKAILNSR